MFLSSAPPCGSRPHPHLGGAGLDYTRSSIHMLHVGRAAALQRWSPSASIRPGSPKHPSIHMWASGSREGRGACFSGAVPAPLRVVTSSGWCGLLPGAAALAGVAMTGHYKAAGVPASSSGGRLLRVFRASHTAAPATLLPSTGVVTHTHHGTHMLLALFGLPSLLYHSLSTAFKLPSLHHGPCSSQALHCL
jgi:hypothetical protein